MPVPRRSGYWSARYDSSCWIYVPVDYPPGGHVSTLLPNRLSPLGALAHLIEGTKIAAHPLALAMQLDSHIVSARHLEYLSRRVARAIETPNSRLIVSMPPRHGKSETISHWSCVWALARDPRCRVLLASYEAD